MKKLLIMLAVLIMLVGSGCTTMCEYEKLDPDTGKVIEKGTREEDLFTKLFDEMKVKDIAWWRCGWFFKIVCTFTGQETYFPNITISGGKIHKGHISLTKNSKINMAECIRAMQTPISVTVTKDGAKIEEKILNQMAEDRKEMADDLVNGD